MKRNLVSTITALLVLAILVLYLIAFQVRENERTFVARFGKFARAQTEAGLYWKWPWPMERVYRFDGRIRVFEDLVQEAMTNDSKNLVVKVAVGWSVEAPQKFYERVATPEKAQLHLMDAARNYKNEVIGKHDLGHFVSPHEEDLKLDEMEEQMMGSLAGDVEDRYGVKVHFVRITQLGLPEDVTSDVFGRMKAERQRIAGKIVAEGERRATEIRATADKERKDILADAEAKALELRGEGDAAAAKYYDIFKKNPELTVFLAELEALKKMKNRTTVVLDPQSPPFNLLLGAPRDLKAEGRSAAEAPKAKTAAEAKVEE